MTKTILITGMYTSQCVYKHHERSQMKIIPSHTSLYDCLTDMGYNVEQRAVEIGEDVTKYSHVFVYPGNLSGFCTHGIQAGYVLSQRPDAIVAWDDWMIDIFVKSVKSKTESIEKFYSKYFLNMNKFDSINDIPAKYIESSMEGVKSILSPERKSLVSVFAGGDPTLLFKDVLNINSNNLCGFNPNPYHFNRQASTLFVEKNRVFNFAGKVQDRTKKWLEKQNVEQTGWTLKLYGDKKQNQERLTEDEMVNTFAQHWGILMAGYSHAGSGWWRARPLQVADVSSILIGEPKEMILYYHDEQLANIHCFDLVEKSDKELEEIAVAQKEALYKYHPLDKDVQKAELERVLS